MKGIIFNLFEELVVRDHGEETWDAILERASLDGAYTSLGSYSDEEFAKLMATASKAFDTEPDDVLRWLGRESLPLLAERYPQLFEPHDGTRSFLLTLNDIIHPEVRKLYPGADVPVFDYDSSSEDVLVMGYRSSRRLCAFGEGLVEGAAGHYGEQVGIEQPLCMNRGDEKCILRVSLHR